MDSSFSNTTGTLDNDTTLSVAGETGAENVNIAIHDADTKTQVKIDGAEIHEASFKTKLQPITLWRLTFVPMLLKK